MTQGVRDGRSRDPRALAKGCLGEFLGELLIYAALAALAGLLVLCARGVAALVGSIPLLGGAAVTVVAVGFLYGLLWTIRVRPGLYLEQLKDDADRQGRLGTDHRRARIAGMAFMQIVCLALVGFVVTTLVWS